MAPNAIAPAEPVATVPVSDDVLEVAQKRYALLDELDIIVAPLETRAESQALEEEERSATVTVSVTLTWTWTW